MNKTNLILALTLSIASIATAGELGRNGGGTGVRPRPAQSSGARPSVVAPSRDARAQSGTMRAGNTGIDSLRVAAQVANQAAACTRGQMGKTPVACSNVDKTNRFRNLNLTNLNGCRLIEKGRASCYGTRRDGFIGGPTLIGPMDPTDMTAACDPSLKGKIIVVRNTANNQTRAVTCTDTGAFKSKYGRIIDLAAGAFDAFGLRCERDGIMRNVELYSCPGT